jgi:hypothetical protein
MMSVSKVMHFSFLWPFHYTILVGYTGAQYDVELKFDMLFQLKIVCHCRLIYLNSSHDLKSAFNIPGVCCAVCTPETND